MKLSAKKYTSPTIDLIGCQPLDVLTLSMNSYDVLADDQDWWSEG